ncbi:MAG: Ig-like domain-containing protein [Alphaproteobacteria bacterium]|nr:Ig-like domain-containing protein [Alphaproteobacteria bacterium]
MVSKPAIVGVLGGVAILAALGLNFWLVPGDDEAEPPRAEAPAVPTKPQVPATSGSSTSTYPSVLPEKTASGSEPSAQGTAAAPPAADTQVPRKPSFDIVRVDPEGNAVIAGRAQPNTEVTILDGDREVGKVTSDERGEWVFLPDHQLGPGQFALTLRQEGEPDIAESDEAVVLVVPEPGRDIAGRATNEPSQPLAMVLPRGEASVGAARVLQAPAAGPGGSSETAATGTATGDAGATDQSGGTAPGAQPKTVQSGAEPGSVGPVVSAFPEPSKAPAGSDQTVASVDVKESGDVSVDVIEYDDKGQVVFGGRTEPNADVEVFIDNKPAGGATADAEGRWQLTPKEPVAPGNYSLRVDKVDEGGKVNARVAFPFVRAAPLKGLPNDRLVVIQPGNNLWVIATRVYGEGMRYVQIHDANRDQIQNPDLIFPGQVFGLPTVN